MCAYACVFVRACAGIYACVCVCVVCVCVCVCVRVCVCMLACMCISATATIWFHRCVSTCACVCVCASVCTPARSKGREGAKTHAGILVCTVHTKEEIVSG